MCKVSDMHIAVEVGQLFRSLTAGGKKELLSRDVLGCVGSLRMEAALCSAERAAESLTLTFIFIENNVFIV